MLANIISGGTGGIIFLIFYFVVLGNMRMTNPILSLIISAVAAIVGFFGMWFIVNNYQKSKMGVVKDIIEEEKKKIDQIIYHKRQINKMSVRNKIDEIIATAKKIFYYMRKNPAKANLCKEVMSYYMDTTLALVQKYEVLEGSMVNAVADTMRKAEDGFVTINNALGKQFAKIIGDEMMEIDSEIETLKEVIELEDL